MRAKSHPDAKRRAPAEERFVRYVAVQMNGCWEWTGSRFANGYGQFDRGAGGAHRFAWQMWRGPIPDRLHLDHRCRNRACVNPCHLELVTAGENVLRGVGFAAVNARATHCLRGHELPAARLLGGRRRRQCLACNQLRTQAWAAVARLLSADDPRHGRVGTYTSYHCRCDLCRGAWREYHRARRRQPKPVPA